MKRICNSVNEFSLDLTTALTALFWATHGFENSVTEFFLGYKFFASFDGGF